MPKIRETRYFTYVKTCSYKRVVDPFLQENQILQLEAIRNIQFETPRENPQSVKWITHLERTVDDMDINYHIKKHGGYTKQAAMDFINKTHCRDLWVKSATVVVDNDDLRKVAAELLKAAGIPADSITAGERYVAYFQNTPCRRFPQEDKAPQWVQDVTSFRTTEEIELGFEPGVLDLVHLLPFDIWREVKGKTRISRAFEREVEHIKDALNVHNSPNFSKAKVMYAIFPKTSGFVGGRQEVLTGKNTWTIVGFD